ncbi:hypothetical protein [Saccharopolyspora taberi]|uniref:hypothetical protein n=1 Tax=Saccharopolyspora taberi TaxID=60895 RepID=UPI0031D8A426
MHPRQEPTFLPLTVGVARSAAGEQDDPERRRLADAVCRRAEEAESAATGCWAALLGGCESAERRGLPARLRALAEATTGYVGEPWWFGHGSVHRRRVAEAQLRINDAVREGDGAEFAEAFVGYDQAIATAVVSVRSKLESPTP